jgi:putative RNA 2'-phosphotransferase
VDLVRLSKTMTFLLRHKPEAGELDLDDEGWADIGDLAVAVSRLLKLDVAHDQITHVAHEGAVRRFEVASGRIRAFAKADEAPAKQHKRVVPPDILYHATSRDAVEEIRATGRLEAGPDRYVYLSGNEAQAWRAAHRSKSSSPAAVLYVDAARARRHGVRFFRHRRNGLYLSTSISASDVLNLHPKFAEQLSAGGVPLRMGEDGVPRLALIEVARRSGVTWEVAKGKLEEGEPPERAAVREVREEMGIDVDLAITRFVGTIRYGFLAPGGEPRLKSVYLYLMAVDGDIDAFAPSHREGIGAVRWFTPAEAAEVVTHASLVPMMRRARDLVLKDPTLALPPPP